MLSEKMQKALNKQVQAEMYSANLYLAMSVYCDFKGLKGVANWLRVQYQEETAHALLLLDYVKERGGRAEVLPIDAPPAEFGTITEVFKAVLKHEQHVTGLINSLYEMAIAEKDFAAQIFLQWFVNEQVEEEANAADILNKLEVIGDSGVNVLYMDKELSTRVFVPPSIGNAN